MSLGATVPGSRPNYPSTLDPDQDRMPGPPDGEPLLSCSISTETTTSGSETDVVRKSSASDVETELDYETSSEGPFRLSISSQSTETVARKWYPGESRNAAVSVGNATENKSVQNDGTGGNQPSGDKTLPREERAAVGPIYAEKIVRALTRSESMPALRNTLPGGDIKTQPGIDSALMSDSSLACQRKMRMIMAQMALLLSAESNVATNSAETSMTGFPCAEEEREEPESQMPGFQTVDNKSIHRPKEVSFRDLSENKRSPELRKLYPRERIGPSIATETEKPPTAKSPEEDGGLINIASNPHPSIKSVYFPPNPCESTPSRDQEIQRRYPRVSNDLEALLRIDGELSPLRRELSQITGKFRALNLISVDRGLTARSSSGYFLRGSRSIAKEQLPTVTVIGKESQEAFDGRPPDNGRCLLERGSIPWRPADPGNSTEIQPLSANHEQSHYSPSCVEYQGSSRTCFPGMDCKDCPGCGRKTSGHVIEDSKLPKRCASLAKVVKGGPDGNSSESVLREGNSGMEASMEGIQGGSFKSLAPFGELRNCTYPESSTKTSLRTDSNQESWKNVHSYYKMSKDLHRNSSGHVIEDSKLSKRCASLAKVVKGGPDGNSSESVPREGNSGMEASMEGIQGGSFKSLTPFGELRNCTHPESSTKTSLRTDSNQESWKNVHSYYKMSKDLHRNSSGHVIEDSKLSKRCASLAKVVKGGPDGNSSESVPREGNSGMEPSMEDIQGGSFKSLTPLGELRNCTHPESSTKTSLRTDSNQKGCKNVHSYCKLSKDLHRSSSRLHPKCRQDSDRETRERKSCLKIHTSSKRSGETQLVRKRYSNYAVDPSVQSTERKSQMEAVVWTDKRDENGHRRNSKTGHYPRDQNLSGSKGCLTILQLDKTRRLDYTRFSSASLVVRTKKETKRTVEPKPFGQNDGFSRKVRDLEIQCSRINVSHHCGQVFLGPSIKSLLRESVKASSTRIPETEEKVVIVPLIFTNGVPEPPAVQVTNSSQGTSSSGREIARLCSRTTSWSRKDRSFGSSLGSTGQERVQDEAWESTCSTSTYKDSLNNRSGSSPWSRIRTDESKREPSGVIGRRVARPMRGMRSSPEDFLCDT